MINNDLNYAMVIGDVSETLKNIFFKNNNVFYIRDASGKPVILESLSLSFNPPVSMKTVEQPTINLFLYDIREDIESRVNTYTTPGTVETPTGFAVRPSAMMLACSYLVTAWSVGGKNQPIEEQWLLSQVLGLFTQFPEIPELFLYGSLNEQNNPDMKDLPLPSINLLQDSAFKNTFEFWPSLQIDMRASFTITVIATFPVYFRKKKSPDELHKITTVKTDYIVDDGEPETITYERKENPK